jgi:hypothetical protein
MRKLEKIAFSYIAWAFYAFAAVFCGSEIALHSNMPAYLSDLLVLLIYLAPVPVMAIAGWIHTEPKAGKPASHGIGAAEWMLLAFAGQLAINLAASVFLPGPKLNNVTNTELYMFYVSVACGEECIFRLFLVRAVLWAGFYLTRNRWAVWSVAVGLSALLFMLSHAYSPVGFWLQGQLTPGVYSNNPAMLVATFGAGAWLAGVFIASKFNAAAVMGAHAIYDAMVDLQLVI